MFNDVYIIKDNINAFNKTLNKPSKADSAAMLDPHYALLPNQCVYFSCGSSLYLGWDRTVVGAHAGHKPSTDC
jgi:hypothetical protein